MLLELRMMGPLYFLQLVRQMMKRQMLEQLCLQLALRMMGWLYFLLPELQMMERLYLLMLGLRMLKRQKPEL